MTTRDRQANRQAKRLRLTALGLCVALVAGACGGTTADDESGDSGSQSDMSGSQSVMRYAVRDFANDTFDLAMEDRNTSSDIVLPLYDTVLEIGEDGLLVGGLATDWGVDDEGLTWTFELRDDAVFHNGDPVTAHDVAFSVGRFLDPASTSRTLNAKEIESYEAVDDYTFKITTFEPNLQFPFKFSPHQANLGIFPRDHLLEAAGEDFTAQSESINDNPIGSGPWKFAERTLGDFRAYEAVEDHWRSTPQVDRLEIYMVPEPATQLAMLLSGDVDLISVALEQVGRIKETEGLGVQTINNAYDAAYFVLGTYRPAAEGKATADAQVRKAMSMAIDREGILRDLLGGNGSLKTTHYDSAPWSDGVDVSRLSDWADELNTYNPEKARAMLEDAGWGDGFEVNIDVYPSIAVPNIQDIAQVLASQWGEIGITANVRPTDYGSFRKHYVGAPLDDDYNAGDPMMNATPPRYDPVDMLENRYSWPRQVGILLGPDDPITPLIAKMRAETNDERRQDILHEAFDIVNNEWLLPPLFSVHIALGYNAKVIQDVPLIEGWPYLGRTFERVSPA